MFWGDRRLPMGQLTPVVAHSKRMNATSGSLGSGIATAAKEAGERWFPQSYPVPVYALRWYTSAPASRSLEANELFVGTFHSERAPIDQLNQPVWIEARGKWALGSDVKENELNVRVNGILRVRLVIVEYILLDSQTDKLGGGKCTEPLNSCTKQVVPVVWILVEWRRFESAACGWRPSSE
ncbi:hypothetical protein BDR06DRAFT_993221 [Suillus hirtellus]|nr:hypothetical protein BDR06DRAFT_993221 [Suillus hirtellus]